MFFNQCLRVRKNFFKQDRLFAHKNKNCNIAFSNSQGRNNKYVFEWILLFVKSHCF